MDQKVIPEWSSVQFQIYESGYISPRTQPLALQLRLAVLETWCPSPAVPPVLHGVTVHVTSFST